MKDKLIELKVTCDECKAEFKAQGTVAEMVGAGLAQAYNDHSCSRKHPMLSVTTTNPTTLEVNAKSHHYMGS